MKKPAPFLQKYWKDLNRLLIAPKADEDCQDKFDPDIEYYYEWARFMVEQGPLCKHVKKGRKCRKPVFFTDLTAVFIFSYLLKYSDRECIRPINEFRKREYWTKRFTKSEWAEELERLNQQGGRKPWELGIDSIRNRKAEIVGDKDIVCRCGGRYNLLRETPKKFTAKEEAIYFATHRGNAKNKELAGWFNVTPSAISQQLRQITKLIPPWHAEKTVKISMDWSDSKKKTTIPKPTTKFASSQDLEYMAEPTPRTKAGEKILDDRKKGLDDSEDGGPVKASTNRRAGYKREPAMTDKSAKDSKEKIETNTNENNS